MKILVVDDDKIIRMGLAKMLNRLFDQHEVVSAFSNGLLALDYLKENNVDLVITDIKMPIMTGSELIEKAVRELHSPPVFLVLSGYDEFTYVRDTMKLGAFNYLLKPIKQDELKNVIEEVEIKIKEKNKQEKTLSKSIDILKKDFFKHILFSSSNINYKTDNRLLENIQLNEDYHYKIVIIDRDRNKEKILVNTFIKNIIEEFHNVEYLTFHFEESTYIIFYLDCNKGKSIDSLSEYINNEVNIFVEENINVYLLESIDEVWKLRDQSRNFRKIKDKIINEDKAKKYLLNLSEGISDNTYEESSKPNLNSINLAKQYIIDNFNKNITLKEVADEVFLSQNYLSELFKKEVGEGFYDFLSRYRINVAKELLLKTNLKIYEIAEKVGYNDSITFGRAFKKIIGKTPNSFRNNKGSI